MTSSGIFTTFLRILKKFQTYLLHGKYVGMFKSWAEKQNISRMNSHQRDPTAKVVWNNSMSRITYVWVPVSSFLVSLILVCGLTKSVTLAAKWWLYTGSTKFSPTKVDLLLALVKIILLKIYWPFNSVLLRSCETFWACSKTCYFAATSSSRVYKSEKIIWRPCVGIL